MVNVVIREVSVIVLHISYFSDYGPKVVNNIWTFSTCVLATSNYNIIIMSLCDNSPPQVRSRD